MNPDQLVGVSVLAIFFGCLALEAALGNGRPFPAIRGWRLIGLAALVVTLAVNTLVPPLVLTMVPAWRLFDLSGLGTAGALPAFVLATFVSYWIHRIQHRSDLLWRLVGHQLHHSVQRVDVSSATIIHPFDVALQTSMTALATLLLGVTIEAAAAAGVTGFAVAVFQHLNVRTPRWIGYLVQRPESHMLHHERNVHSRNFGDLPVWDMLFGTYCNPERADVEVGFEPERSRKVMAMLVGIDVNRAAERAARARLRV